MEGEGKSRAAKRRRKEQMKRSAPPVPPKTAEISTGARDTSKKGKNKVFTKESRAEMSPDLFDLQAILQSEEETMSILHRKDLLFAHLIQPMKISNFYDEFFEIQPVHIKSIEGKSFEALFSMPTFHNIIQHHLLMDTKDIEIATYKDFIEYDANHQIKKYNQEISDPVSFDNTQIQRYLKDRQNICLLNPQVFDDSLWRYLSTLELEFQSCLSMKVYYIHPISAMHAPHSNNANIFIIQLQGSTNLKIFSPQHIDQDISLVLQDHIIHGQKLSKLTPDVDSTLKPNDTMYVPKGWIVDFSNDSRELSLFLCLSTNEGNNLADVVDMILPQALSAQISMLPVLKRSVPSTFINVFGVAKTDDLEEVNPERVDQEQLMRSILNSLVNESIEMLDAVADQVSSPLHSF